MDTKSLNTSWSKLKKHFNTPESNNATQGKTKQGGKLAENKPDTELFDWAIYCSLYDDIREHGITDEKKALLHYAKYGKKEGRVTSFTDYLKSFGIDKTSLPPDFTLAQFAVLNSFELMDAGKKIERFLHADKPGLLKISAIDTENSRFLLELAVIYDMAGKKEKAYHCYLYSNYFIPNANALEHMGNRHLSQSDYAGASALYASALRLNNNRKWAHKNLLDCYIHLKKYDEAIAAAIEGLKAFPDFNMLKDSFNHLVDIFWQENEQKLTALCLCSDRATLILEVEKTVKYIERVYREQFLLLSHPIKAKINQNRVLIIGDFGLTQCRRYRIYQKVEQLADAGYEANAMPWNDAQKNLADQEQCHLTNNDQRNAGHSEKKVTTKIYENLAFEEAIALHDIIIFYRVPAFPRIVKLIAQARALGKVTFYEIDDLMFDPIYPPPLETYGGSVKDDYFFGLIKGMAFYRSAAKLCQYGIASTQPLCDKLGDLVTSGQCYLHRNGLDSNTAAKLPVLRTNKEFVDIFYGTGTHAHNTDFIIEVLPALDLLLTKHTNLRLTIAGYLQLPGDFLKKYPDQVILKPFANLAKYLSYLADADINVAVLTEDEINDCKSELKWFEAANLGIPSVVSRTQNYLDVVHNGEDGFIVSGTDEWVSVLEALIADPNKRLKIGQAAYKRVQNEYSILALANNMSHIIESAANDFNKTTFSDAVENKELPEQAKITITTQEAAYTTQ